MSTRVFARDSMPRVQDGGKFENLKVWDPNLKVSSSKFLGSQGLGVSEVGRSAPRSFITRNIANLREL